MLANRVRMGSGGKKTIIVNVYLNAQGYTPVFLRVDFYSLKKPIIEWNDFERNPDDYIGNTYDITNTSESNTMQIELEPTNNFMYGHNGFLMYDSIHLNGVEIYDNTTPHKGNFFYYNSREVVPWEIPSILQDGDTIRINPYFD